MSTLRRAVSTLIAVLIVLIPGVFAGCASQGDTAIPGFTYLDLLATIPDQRETRGMVWIDDYSLVREIFDVPSLPVWGDGDDALDALYKWETPFTYELDANAPPVISFGNTSFFGPFRDRESGISLIERSRHLGFDVRNMGQSIVAGLPTVMMDVSSGSFAPGSTANALDSCGECPRFSRDEYRSVSYYSWSEGQDGDMGLAFILPVFDRLGRGGHLAVTDRFVLRTLKDSDMKLLIDTFEGERRSLADLEEFQLLADGMAQLRSYSMLLSDMTFSLDGGYGESLTRATGRLEKWVEPGPLQPYAAYGVGAGRDGEGPYMALALVHDNSSQAEDNVSLLRARIDESTSVFYETPWADKVEESEIMSEGRLLLAKLRGNIAVSPVGWVFSNDNLILHK